MAVTACECVYFSCPTVDSRSNNGDKESGGHAHWSQGLLFDYVKEEASESNREPVLNLHNREDAGADLTAHAHGWSSVYSVLWNCTVDNLKYACVQQPPTSQNFAIGTNGTANGVNWFPENPTGYIEDEVGTLEPASLYRAQLEDRVGINLIDL